MSSTPTVKAPSPLLLRVEDETQRRGDCSNQILVKLHTANGVPVCEFACDRRSLARALGLQPHPIETTVPVTLRYLHETVITEDGEPFEVGSGEMLRI